MKAVFPRREHQSSYGNITHAHIIISVDWDKLSEEKMFFVKKTWTSLYIFVIRSDDIKYFITKNIISSKYEVDNDVESAINFLTHKYNDVFMVKISTGELRFRMRNYCQMTSDNTKQMFTDIPLTVTKNVGKGYINLG